MKNNFSAKATADEVLKGHDFKGKNVIVTGSNSGIGFESAKVLAKASAHVILACRSKEKAENAIIQIKYEVPNASLVYLPLDLASFPSIENFVKLLKLDKIDVLINNAGIMSTHFETTPQKQETTAGVNHFGHFYLTKLLLPILVKSKARVVVLSSESHKQTKSLDLKSWPQNKTNFGFNSAYAKSKLANILFADELCRRYSELSVASCHPGALVTTSFGDDSIFLKIVFTLISPFTKSAAQGASTPVFCASQPAEIINGNYFSDNKKIRKSALAENEVLAKELWEFSEREVEKFLSINI